MDLFSLALGFGSGVIVSIYAPRVWAYLQARVRGAIERVR